MWLKQCLAPTIHLIGSCVWPSDLRLLSRILFIAMSSSINSIKVISASAIFSHYVLGLINKSTQTWGVTCSNMICILGKLCSIVIMSWSRIHAIEFLLRLGLLHWFLSYTAIVQNGWHFLFYSIQTICSLLILLFLCFNCLFNTLLVLRVNTFFSLCYFR